MSQLLNRRSRKVLRLMIASRLNLKEQKDHSPHTTHHPPPLPRRIKIWKRNIAVPLHWNLSLHRIARPNSVASLRLSCPLSQFRRLRLQKRCQRPNKLPPLLPMKKTLAKKPQETIDKLFTSMQDLSEAGWPRASANQSVSPTESTASRSLGRTESTSTSILSSQHVQETPTIGCGGTIRASPPTLHAEFSWLDPQQLTTTGSTHSVNRSSSGDNAQASIPTSGHNSCRPQHVSQGFKDRELEYVDHQNSSSTPGSSRSAPFQIVDDYSDYPHYPSTASTKLSSPFVKTRSPQNRTADE
jgi:hypothetical protein